MDLKKHMHYYHLQVLSFALIAVFHLSSCKSVSIHPSPKQPFKFVQLCDTQLGKGGYEHDIKTFKQAVIQINELKPDFVVICGDLVARPLDYQIKDFNSIRAGFKIPCHCVPGNHDVFHPVLARKKGVTPEQSLANYRKNIGKDYYAFEHKGYTFICVNDQLWIKNIKDESKKHDLWVKNELQKANEKQSPVFIIGHYPLYTEKPDEKNHYYNFPIEKRNELLELYTKHGVVAVVTGHTHRIVINDYKGIQLVSGETTSTTSGSPLGFRLWHIENERPFKHVSVPLKMSSLSK
jgi:serine/threonine-protein phosphatase CPPED1